MARFPEDKDTLESIPIKTIDLGTCFYRVSGTEYDSAVFYSGCSQNRWTPIGGKPGVCYMAESPIGALAESVCRNVAHLDEAEMFSSLSALRQLGMYELVLRNSVTVLDFTVAHLGRYRLDATILGDYDESLFPPYKFSPAWASHAVELNLAGILYRSRHKIDETCLALFDVGTDIGEGGCGKLDDNQYLEILEDEFKWGVI
ncbi:RES family NAD+ phosphorylase [Vreelandella sp. H-I2]